MSDGKFITYKPLDNYTLANVTELTETITKRIVEDSREYYNLGTLSFFGFLENEDIREYAEKARYTDALVLGFDRLSSFPAEKKFQPRIDVASGFCDAKEYADLPLTIKMIVKGTEQQMVRRVIAVTLFQRMKAGHGGDIIHHIDVPITEEERFHGSQLTNEELVELVNFIWAFNPQKSIGDNPIRLSAKDIHDKIIANTHYKIKIDRVTEAVIASDQMCRMNLRKFEQFDKEVIKRIVIGYQGEDPPIPELG